MGRSKINARDKDIGFWLGQVPQKNGTSFVNVTVIYCTVFRVFLRGIWVHYDSTSGILTLHTRANGYGMVVGPRSSTKAGRVGTREMNILVSHFLS